MDAQIAENIAVHDRIARKYEARHGEIFNEIEQARLNRLMGRAVHEIRSGGVSALDYGCGSGNLTAHLLAHGAEVTAADVSRGFLDLVRDRYPVATLLMNGRDLSGVPDERFDLIATYSVLHHIPDYIGAVREIARVCKPGGIIVLDHEPTEAFWNTDYSAFRREALKPDWRKFLSPANYVHKIRRLFNPRHTNEGDIHVWPDDHVEWPRIKEALAEFEIVAEDEYLLYRQLYRREVYNRYVGRITDTKAMIFRK